MSAYVAVAAYGERIAVICPECNIDHEYAKWTEARDRCKEHNLWLHERSIRWEQ